MQVSETHPWQSAYDEFLRDVLPGLLRIGKQIGVDSIGEAPRNQHARDVIECYTKLHASFDPMTFTLLKEHLAKYEATLKEARS